MEQFIRLFFYATVFTTGAAVLVLEVTAVRLLSPYFGSSLYVFSSVLTIVLGALSFGYYIGGKLSDRIPSHEPLYMVVGLSGVSVLVMQLIALITLPFGGAVFSIISGPLVFGAVLFFVPAFLLGIISPYIIKLQSLYTSTEHIGETVGATFFWGTLGSIAGSLATGFVLIPFLGVAKSIFGTGLVLVLLGICGGAFVSMHSPHKRVPFSAYMRSHRRFLFMIVLATVLLSVFILRDVTHHEAGTLYKVDGLYSRIHIYETIHHNETVRVLERDTNHSSAVSLGSYDLIFGYTQFAELYTHLLAEARSYLLIGGGAYSMPRTLVARDPYIKVDVAEIEPSLFALARQYFDLSDISRITNHVMDGRVFLQKSEAEHDVIFVDAFGTDLSIPHHLATKEFFQEVKKDLAPDGILMLNYVGTLHGKPPTPTGSLIKTLKSVFPNVHVYAFNKTHPTSLQNIVFVARNGAKPIDLSRAQVRTTGGEVRTLPEMEVHTSQFTLLDEAVFTDDWVPLEYLMLKQL